MHRGQLLFVALPWASSARGAGGPVEVPVVCLTNTRAATTPEAVRAFRAGVWAAAVRSFAEGGVALRVRERAGEIPQYPSSRPRFVGLARGERNVVLTDPIALEWDRGRQVAGGSTVYEGYVVCVSCCMCFRETCSPRGAAGGGGTGGRERWIGWRRGCG